MPAGRSVKSGKLPKNPRSSDHDAPDGASWARNPSATIESPPRCIPASITHPPVVHLPKFSPSGPVPYSSQRVTCQMVLARPQPYPSCSRIGVSRFDRGMESREFAYEYPYFHVRTMPKPTADCNEKAAATTARQPAACFGADRRPFARSHGSGEVRAWRASGGVRNLSPGAAGKIPAKRRLMACRQRLAGIRDKPPGVSAP